LGCTLEEDQTLDTDLIQRVLMIIERDLRRVVAPGLGDAPARLKIDYMIRLLQWTSAQVGRYDDLARAHATQLQSLLEHAGIRERVDGGSTSAIKQPVSAEIETLRTLGANAGRHPELFRRYVDIETALVKALDTEGGDGFGDVYKGGKLASAEHANLPQCDEPTLSAYLQRRFASSGARATGVTSLAGGFGKDTILFNIQGCGTFDGAAVIRKDFTVRPGPIAVTDEFPLLQTLYQNGFTVAEPLWSEPNETVLGGPFIVSRRVIGTSAAAGWQESEDMRVLYVDRFASILAQLHGFSENKLFERVDVSATTAFQAHISMFYDHYRARAREVSGRLEAAFAWLEANLPADEMTARLVHGDVGFHNILMEDGQINALLDWEFAHFGHPAEDIGYCWQFLEKLIGWDEFMAMYTAHGGKPVSLSTASYYRVWGDIRNAVMGVGALGTVALSDEADIRSPAAALAFGPLLELQALRGAVEWNNAYGKGLGNLPRH
jgi:aminoglycoside phosphotransferase (APT) family kinase protein